MRRRCRSCRAPALAWPPVVDRAAARPRRERTLSPGPYAPHMPDALGSRQPSDEVSLHVEAPPERIYEIVTDIAQMGRLSPECTGGKWLDGATGPAVGARFKGSNKRGWARWSTTNEVVAAEPGAAFSFETQQSGTRW